jgi:O-antigen ligase
MPPFVATILWFILLLVLFRFDPARDPETSPALWVPVTWMFIVGSRLPAQWLGMQAASKATALEEGNPLDRAVWSGLILLAVWILTSRSFEWRAFLAANPVLMAFLAFALLSILWSDFPFVSFKRWFRDFGDYLVIPLILSDPRPLEAVRTVLRRVFYLLIPLSILLIRYYHGMSVHYDSWSGLAEYTGATTSKNMLGVVCLVSAIFFFWDTVTRWGDRREWQTRRIIAVNLAFIVMTLWVLHLARCTTCDVCLVIGWLVIALGHSSAGKRHPGFLKVLAPVSFFLYLIVAFGLNMNGQMAQALGRKADLTGRTFIWQTLLSMHTNPLFGTGYRGFWLGSRLDRLSQTIGNVTEAHNGYLEIYLELGLIGLFILCTFLATSYRTICKKLKPFTSFGSLSLAFWTMLLFYNMTEASFAGSLMWMTFLLGAVTVPLRAADEERGFAEALLGEPPICATR